MNTRIVPLGHLPVRILKLFLRLRFTSARFRHIREAQLLKKVSSTRTSGRTIIDTLWGEILGEETGYVLVGKLLSR